MKSAETLARKIIVPLYVLGLLGMLAIVIAVCIPGEYHENKKMTADYTDISACWTLDRAGTEPVDLNRLGAYMDEKTGVLSIYYRLPSMDNDKSLVYRSKDVYTKLLIDNEIVYETDVYESRFYNRSPGNLWNMAEIYDCYSGALAELQIFMVYDTNAITVDFTMWGDKADIILSLCRRKATSIVVSVLMLIIGLVLIAFDLMPAYKQARKHHGMIWLGLYSVLIGICSFIETNVLQFFVLDMRILQLVGNIVMITGSMPLLLYLDCEYQIFKNRFMRIFCYLNVVYILVCVSVQFLGVGDLHDLLSGAMITMIVSCVALLAWVAIQIRKMRKEHQKVFRYVLQLSGLCGLWISALCEIMRYSQSDHMDRAEYLRVGMLIFVVCLAISSQIETYRLLENGLKFDIIRSLAYSDGLTGLGNRTAYLEQLEAYACSASGVSQLGIVFLDVNNLKKVNDNQGHEKGDELITLTADIIQKSFGKFGKSYRIGGDEFCVLITGLSLQEKYDEGLCAFQHLIDAANRTKKYTFEVQIANGFCICDTLEKEKIDAAVMLADSLMYENKRLLKYGYVNT